MAVVMASRYATIHGNNTLTMLGIGMCLRCSIILGRTILIQARRRRILDRLGFCMYNQKKKRGVWAF